MPDRWVVLMAVSAAAGALRPSAVPLLLTGGLAVVAVAWQRPALLCLAVALCTSSLAARAEAGLEGVVAGPVRSEVVLLTDPAPALGGIRAEARLGHQRVDLRASSAVVPDLVDRLAGERLVVRGEVGPLSGGSGWARARHLAGRLTVHRVEAWREGSGPARVANGLRRTIARGALALPVDQRALYAGLVLGDDRAQTAALEDDFTGAGLTHLLAVSGQNVAFVLALVAPLGRRLRLAPRLLLTLAVIGLFGLMTRFEPSVLRASVMAAVAAGAVTAGAPLPKVRVLGLAITALLLLDPLLVGSVAFQLSVMATSAIAVGAEAVAGVLPGPSWLRESGGVTIAAQLGVAPVLLANFGPIPLASLPANVLAVPAAGLVMAWGLTGGVVAGVAPAALADVVHLPTRLLLDWLVLVARRSAALPLGELGWPAVLAVAGGLGGAAIARRRAAAPMWQRAGAWVAVAAAVLTVVAAGAPVGLRSEPGSGIVRWHAGSTDVVVLGGGGWRTRLQETDVLAALRRAGVGSIDLVVVSGSGVRRPVLDAVLARHPAGAVIAAEGPEGAVAPPDAMTRFVVGDLLVTIAPGRDRVVVEAQPVGASGANL